MNFDWSVVWQFSGPLAKGAGVTILLTIATMAVAMPGGIVLALMRLSSNKVLNWIALCFVEFFRNIPLILLVYWTFYVLPVLSGLSFSPFATGLIALALNVSAYNSETFRAGINSIRKGQTEAALALGMSRYAGDVQDCAATGRAARAAGAGQYLGVAVQGHFVGVGHRRRRVSPYRAEIRSQTFRILEMLTAMAVIYWVLGYPQAKLVDWIYRRWGVKE